MASLNIGFKGVFSFDILLKGNGVFRILRRPRCPFLFGYQRKARIQKTQDEDTARKKKEQEKEEKKMKTVTVPEYFGSKVFDDRVMKAMKGKNSTSASTTRSRPP